MTTLLPCDNLFYYLPSDILHGFINYFDNRTTIRFLSTCAFLYEQEIKCKKILIKDNNIGGFKVKKLKWIIDLVEIEENDRKKILLTTKILKEYFKICNYQYLFFKYWNSEYELEILGAYTDIPANILNSLKIYSNCRKIVSLKIIDHRIYRQIIFTKCIYDFLSILIESKEYILSTFRHSEIIKGRHPIYFENNIAAEHTASKNIEIESKSYFLSCYTAPLI